MPNKYSLECALLPDISTTIIPLAPQSHSAGTAHKKRQAVVFKLLQLLERWWGHAFRFLLLWFGGGLNLLNPTIMPTGNVPA